MAKFKNNNLGCLTGFQSLDGLWEVTVFESVVAALKAPVSSAGRHQTEQVVTRM